jgi:hypothetical protein
MRPRYCGKQGWLLLLAACSGAAAERPGTIAEAPPVARAAAVLMADSASICWQRFSRGVSLAAGCTTLGVTSRVDTVRDTVRLPTPLQAFVPFAFGPDDMYRGPNSAQGFTAGQSYADPQGLLALLAKLRANQQRAFLALTGGRHDLYITDGKFDLDKWKGGVSRYDTPTLRAALESGVADGTILGYNMLDEPPHPSWGGAFTKALVDSMAAYCKSILPFMPCGVAVNHRWRPTERYNLVDFIITQTWMETESPAVFRDSAVAMAKRNGVALVLAFNLFGAAPSPGCETRGNRCLMRAAEVREWGRTFVSEPYACAVTMWHYDPTMWGRPEYQAQFQDVASVARQRVAKPCRRPAQSSIHLQPVPDAGLRQ